MRVLAFLHACFSAVRAKKIKQSLAMLFFDNDAFNRHFGNVRISAARMVVLATQIETEPSNRICEKYASYPSQKRVLYDELLLRQGRHAWA